MWAVAVALCGRAGGCSCRRWLAVVVAVGVAVGVSWVGDAPERWARRWARPRPQSRRGCACRRGAVAVGVVVRWVPVGGGLGWWRCGRCAGGWPWPWGRRGGVGGRGRGWVCRCSCLWRWLSRLWWLSAWRSGRCRGRGRGRRGWRGGRGRRWSRVVAVGVREGVGVVDGVGVDVGIWLMSTVPETNAPGTSSSLILMNSGSGLLRKVTSVGWGVVTGATRKVSVSSSLDGRATR